MSDIKTILTDTPISTVLSSRPLVYLGSKASIGDVLELLSSRGILSAPVFLANDDGTVQNPNLGTLLGFVDVWAVLVAFLQSLPAGGPNGITAEQLEAHGAELCQRSVMSLFDNQPNIKAALEAGSEPHITCADWEMTDDPNTSLLEVIRTCFLPRMPAPGSGLVSCGSGMGFMPHNISPRVSSGGPTASTAGASAAGGASPHAPAAAPQPMLVSGAGHSRHPAASHRTMVSLPDGQGGDKLSVLSQSDILRFLAAKHDCLRPLGKATLTELGLANGSLHLAAGPPSATCARPPPLSPGHASFMQNSSSNNNSSSWAGMPGTPPSHGGGFSHTPLPAVPSSPKPPLSGGGLSAGLAAAGGLGGSTGGGGGILGTSPLMGTSPAGESNFGLMMNALQRGGSGSLAGGSGSGAQGGGGGVTAMGMSPPASPRVSASHLLGRGSSLGGGSTHRAAVRRQLVAVHESVPVLEAFRVLLQQRVSAVAVLAGSGPSPNMRLVGNLSASDLRHLRRGGFGGLALTVKAFLASKPLAPDQAIRVSPPPSSHSSNGGEPGSSKPPAVIMAHAPTCFTCQATASLEELIKMLGGRCAGIHRVYVVDPDQRPAGVVTTTDVLQLLSSACSRD